MTETQHYVAKLGTVPEQDKEYLKAKSCIVSISVGQDSHEGEKFLATMKMINMRFKKCTISVNDTLQRYTIAAIDPLKRSPEELYDEAKKRGDEWIERNLPIITQELKIPFNIIRWDDYLNFSKFQENNVIVRELYANNPDYKDFIENVVLELHSRHKDGKFNNVTFDEFRALSKEYLLEECAAFLQWFDQPYDYELYPSINIKCFETTSAFVAGKTGISPLLLKIRLEKANGSFDCDSVSANVTLENIMRVSPENIYWKDKYGTTLGCNLSQAKRLRYKNVNQVIGKSDFDLFDFETALTIRNNDLFVMRSNKKLVAEENIINSKNSSKNQYFLSYKNPLRDPKTNEVVGVIGISVDITKQKTQELELIEKNKLLEKALQAKNELLNNISHEIKTPLSSILKMTDILYDQWDNYESNEVRKKHLKLAVEANERLSSILFNLLDLSQIRAGKIIYKKQAYSFLKSTKDVLGEFIEHRHRFVLKHNIEDFECSYDHMRMEQVIRNLVSNATKYGGDEEIFININKENNTLHFSIVDSGVGVPEDELNSIFEIFSQSSRTKNKAGGSGIGLSICKTIIQDHGGEIGAESNDHNKGTKFWFYMPIVEGIKEDADEVIVDKSKPKTVVLVIDDEESMLGITSIVLESLGFEVIAANCGIDGLSKLKQHYKKINVVLLDMMMPDIYGLDLLKQIKEDSELRVVPVIMYSGISDPNEIQKSLDLGADDCIDKTSTKEKIFKTLSRYISCK